MDGDLAQALASLLDYLPTSWEGRAMLAVTVCAVLASVIPPPREDAPLLWRILYNVINALACNFRHARNARRLP